jgi:hypothetical protein
MSTKLRVLSNFTRADYNLHKERWIRCNMNPKTSHYQDMIDRLSDWLEQASRHEVLDLIELVDKSKTVLKAVEDLTMDEAQNLERYLLRDIETFSQQFRKEADNSLWLAGLKMRFWQLLASMSDNNKIQLFELEMDAGHKGLYTAGELISVGKIVCEKCGKTREIDFVEEIQPCIACNHQRFARSN